MRPPHARPSSLPGRILARFFLVALGFVLGIALFTPWNKIWALALTSLDASQPMIGLRWDSIDHDGPLGFRINDLRITLADTPGSLAFRHAFVSMGFSPLARVRLDTGTSRCDLDLFRNGIFAFEGNLDLTALLGGGDFRGTLRVAGNFFLPDGSSLPQKGWFDLRSRQLALPDGKTIEDLAFTAEIHDRTLDVRDFSLSQPLAIKAAGRGVIDPDNLFNTAFALHGEMTVGQRTFPYAVKGTLADAVLR